MCLSENPEERNKKDLEQIQIHQMSSFKLSN